MSLLIFALVVVLVVALCVWVVDLVGLPSPVNMIAKAIVALIGLVLIIQRMGAL